MKAKSKFLTVLLTVSLFASCNFGNNSGHSDPVTPPVNPPQDLPKDPEHTITEENPIDVDSAAENISKSGLSKNVKLEQFSIDDTACTVYLDAATGIFEAYDENAEPSANVSARNVTVERKGRLIYRGTYIYNNKLSESTIEIEHVSELWFCVTEERDDNGNLVEAEAKYYSSEVDLGIANNSFTDLQEIVFTETITTKVETEDSYKEANKTFELVSEVYIEEYKETAESALSYTFKVLPTPLSDEYFKLPVSPLPENKGTFPLEFEKEYNNYYDTTYVFGNDGIFTVTRYKNELPADPSDIRTIEYYKYAYNDNQVIITPYKLCLNRDEAALDYQETLEMLISMLDEKVMYEKNIKKMINSFTEETGFPITSYLMLPEDATDIQIYKAIVSMEMEMLVQQGLIEPDQTYEDFMLSSFIDEAIAIKASFAKKDILRITKDPLNESKFCFVYDTDAYNGDLELLQAIKLYQKKNSNDEPNSRYNFIETDSGIVNFGVTIIHNQYSTTMCYLYSAIILSAENGVITAENPFDKKVFELNYEKITDNNRLSFLISGKFYNSDEIVTTLCEFNPYYLYLYE